MSQKSGLSAGAIGSSFHRSFVGASANYPSDISQHSQVKAQADIVSMWVSNIELLLKSTNNPRRGGTSTHALGRKSQVDL